MAVTAERHDQNWRDYPAHHCLACGCVCFGRDAHGQYIQHECTPRSLDRMLDVLCHGIHRIPRNLRGSTRP